MQASCQACLGACTVQRWPCKHLAGSEPFYIAASKHVSIWTLRTTVMQSLRPNSDQQLYTVVTASCWGDEMVAMHVHDQVQLHRVKSCCTAI